MKMGTLKYEVNRGTVVPRRYHVIRQRLRSACASVQSNQNIRRALWITKDSKTASGESEYSNLSARMYRLI